MMASEENDRLDETPQPVEEPVEEDESARLAQKLQEMARDQLRRQMTHGTRLLQAGKPKEAIPFLKRAHELNPYEVDVAINLGGAYILAGQHRLAVPVLEKAAELDPGNVMVWINLGAAYLGNPILATREQQERAIGAFEQALILNPDAPSVHYNLGLIHRDRQDSERARHHFREALRSNPEDQDAKRILRRMDEDDEGLHSRLN